MNIEMKDKTEQNSATQDRFIKRAECIWDDEDVILLHKVSNV